MEDTRKLLDSLMDGMDGAGSGGSLAAALGMGSNGDFAAQARKRAAAQKKKQQAKLRNIEDMAMFTGNAADLALADGELQTTIDEDLVAKEQAAQEALRNAAATISAASSRRSNANNMVAVAVRWQTYSYSA